jgi:cathepsin D
MKKCNASMCSYILSLLGITSAAYLRNNPEVTVGIGSTRIADAHSSRQTWTQDSKPEYKLTLQNYKGVQYYAPITLNNQKLSAVYDTGSFEVMAMSKECTACQVPKPMIKYDQSASSTFVQGGGALQNHQFAGGRVTGRQDFETMSIGDLGKEFKVKEMPFWQVVDTDMTVWISNRAHFTAIVGLGHRSSIPDVPVGQQQVESLLERTETQRFAVCLQKGYANPGYITFNPKLHASPPQLTSLNATANGNAISSMFRRVPVVGHNHWAVQLNEVSSLDGTNAVRLCSTGTSCLAIVDSGTSLIGVPPMGVPLVAKLVQQIKKDCSNLDELPDLVFQLGDQRFTLPPSAYVVEWRAGDQRICVPAFTDFNMNSQHGAVWILGMPFLRHFYTVFDRSEPAMYIADQGLNCEPAARNATMDTAIVNASFTLKRAHQEPTSADIAEATLPSWAYGQSMMEI